MSVLDPSSLLQLTAPELLAPPDPPATPAIDTSTGAAADSTSSGSSQDSTQLGMSWTPQEGENAAVVGSGVPNRVNPYETAAEEAAAALVDVGGASSITVDDYESSVPPNLAAASALLSELAANTTQSGVLSAAYLALSSDDALSLTA